MTAAVPRSRFRWKFHLERRSFHCFFLDADQSETQDGRKGHKAYVAVNAYLSRKCNMSSSKDRGGCFSRYSWHTS